MSLTDVYIRCVLPLLKYKAKLVQIVFLNLLLAVAAVWEPLLLGKVIDALSDRRDAGASVTWWICLAALSTVATVILARSADRLSHVCRAKVLSDSYGRILAMPIEWHHLRGASEVMQTMVRGCESQFSIWLDFMRSHLSTMAAVVLLIPTALNVDPWLGSILLCLGLAYWWINNAVIQRTKSGQRALERHYHNVFSHLNDTIHHISLLHSYNRVREETRLLSSHLNGTLTAQLPVLDWWAFASALNRMATTLSMGAILLLGSFFVQSGRLTLGELTAFVGFAGVLISRLDQIRGFVGQIHESAARLEEFLNIQQESESAGEDDDAPALAPARGKVEFRNVFFRYGAGLCGLHDISFVVEPGQTVAVVGATGAGKSTLVKLLQRIYTPTSGQILIDDVDTLQVSRRSVRDQIAVVSQEAELLNRSIAENIGLGRQGATMEELLSAADAASADRFIRSKPLGYSSTVGDNGARLSGGERQRLAIARAILKAAPILILDEATAALDVETECSVQDAIDHVTCGRTTFIIAHRLSTIRRADLVLVMNDGKIVERGSYAALRERDGIFSRMLEVSGMVA